MSEHTDALAAKLNAAIAEITSAAAAARSSLEGDVAALQALAHPPERPPLIPDVPVDEPPPYIPPPPSASGRALVADTPLVDASSGSAFDDDAPLWQS